jgi:hypothetical protein
MTPFSHHTSSLVVATAAAPVTPVAAAFYSDRRATFARVLHAARRAALGCGSHPTQGRPLYARAG